MKVEVRYYSRGGNTKKVAEAIAKAADVVAKDCGTPVEGEVDLLFLGAAVYGFSLDEAVNDFIKGLEPESVGNVALFSTSALIKRGNTEMGTLLADRGIRVLDRNFHCWGAFTAMHRDHPSTEDLKEAEAFARAAMADCQ